MKYVCTVCGYVYDDAEQAIPFEELPDSWQCPICGAPKALFKKQESGAAEKSEAAPEKKISPTVEKPEAPAIENDALTMLNPGELSALFSNLAKSCEKQYQEEAKNCFQKLADYFEAAAPDETDIDIKRLSDLIAEDLDGIYQSLRTAAVEAGDRGALRIIVWGEKVSRMAKSLIDRYLKEGGAFLENTGLYVCTVCGFLYVGDEPPAICPVCKVAGWKFKKIEGRTEK